MDIASLAAASTQSASSKASSQLTANFDTFLTLLTTQLRNQDPLNPLDTEKFTSQLVQFSSVEQSIKTNQNLEALIALQSSSAKETALSMVGRVATVNSDTASLTDDPARWTYTLPQNAAAVAVHVMDANGTVVATLKGAQTAGAHTIDWSGETDAGGKAPKGAYRLVVEAAAADGGAMNAAVSSRGLVSAVAFGDAGPEIEIAGQRYALDLVSRVDADS